METTDLEFELYLCLQLGKTLKELRGAMDGAEFQLWSVYFGRVRQREELAALRARSRSRR